MLTLGFDTCTEVCAIAVGTEERLLAAFDVHAPRAHLSRLLPLVEQALQACGHGQADIEAVAVGTGPGSLTGVRIGVTTARALAQGLDVPCAGISTLDIIAQAFSRTGALVCVILDARRNEVYPALYECTADMPERLTDYRVVGPEQLCDELAERDRHVLLAGDGLMTYGELFTARLGARATLAPHEHWYPRAANLLPLARATLATGDNDYRAVRPIYARLSDAEEAEKARR